MVTANAQIPNNGFENWNTVGSYENPVGWATMNASCIGPFYSCTKSTEHYPANVGSYSMRVENNTSLTQMTGGWGMAVTDTMAWPFQPSFPITGHPNSLCGYYKFSSLNNDTAWIKVVLFESGTIVLDENFTALNTPSWTSFNIPISSYTIADSATILISAFYPNGPTAGPKGNSVLYVDNLSFDNLISGISPLQISKKSKLIISPNPATDMIKINSDYLNNETATLAIYNLVGEKIKTENLLETQQQINVEGLKEGVYLVEIKSKTKAETERLIIQR